MLRLLASTMLLLLVPVGHALAGDSKSVPVPEPGTLTLVGSGLAALILYARRRRH